MATQYPFLRPQSLIEGHRYSRLERGQDGDGTTYTEITFIAYTSCPAVIVILNGSGQKVRCLREDVFMYITGSNENIQPMNTSLVFKVTKNDN